MFHLIYTTKVKLKSLPVKEFINIYSTISVMLCFVSYLCGMENDDKYYCPDISEFCPGFEYEVDEGAFDNGEHKWTKCVVVADRTVGADKFIRIPNIGHHSTNTVEHIRVKRLDENDLSELRWYKKGDKHYVLKPYNIARQKEGDDNWPTLCFHPDGNVIILRSRTGTCLFDGEIKNKSALKTIMQLIKI